MAFLARRRAFLLTRALLLLLASSTRCAEQPPAEEQEQLWDSARRALKKGLHNKAFEAYSSLSKSLGPPDAVHWEKHPDKRLELQEGLCLSAARLRKEQVAIGACEAAGGAVRGGKRASVGMLMALGEAKFFDGKWEEAGAYFAQAEAQARRGDAVKQEREAAEARGRAEVRMFVSFGRQRGRPAATSLLSKSRKKVEEALVECAATAACKAVGTTTTTTTVGSTAAGPQHISSYSSSEVPPGTASSGPLYVRDAQTRYLRLAGSPLKSRFLPHPSPRLGGRQPMCEGGPGAARRGAPLTTRALGACRREPMTIQRAASAREEAATARHPPSAASD